MPVSVTMPRLGESVTEGTVTRWLKKEGEHVEADEPLLEVSTEKVDTEIPSPASGTLQTIAVSEDETVEVGAELGLITEDSEAGAGQAPAPPEAPEERAPEAEEAAAEPPAPEPSPAAEAPPAAPPEEEAPAPEEQPVREEAPAPPTPPPAEERPREPAPPPSPPPPAPAGTPTPEVAEAQPAPTPYVTPLVRKLASEHGVDLSQVRGTGVGGRVRKQDVLDAAAQAQAAPEAAPAAPAPTRPKPGPEAYLRGRTERMSRMRSVIAQRMIESLQVSAQLTTVVEADLTKIARLRDRAKASFQEREGVKLSFLPFFAQATVEALKVHPKLNASIDTEKGEVTYYDAEHLGIAVDTERGLAAAVIHNAGDLNLGGLARKIADLAERTRSGQVQPDELTGGTFTITNTGSRGALFDTPIINQPQVGILGTGLVVKRPVVVEHPDLGETIAVRHMVYLSLTYDHRLVDGADAARFLQTIKDRLEEGNFEAELGLA